ncbi:ladinin-1 isoform X2 [Ochotona princeps]|uniref:ladinin-1 isoform X2 n=1 Tax=Ochotona princeps TaxID=9978 RepID=UPI0027146446|nr:ladinin-1 isoform X2 [Ochotona princeps]
MAAGRKDWSALSSLARQRTLEDEEEQERERRRRHRNLSTTTEEESPRLAQNGDQQATERLPSLEETETPKPAPSAPQEEEDVQAILRTRRERRQRRQAVEAAGQERLEAEEGRDSVDAGQAAPQAPVPSKDPEPLPRRRLSREQRALWARGEEESPADREPRAGKKGVPEETPASEKSPVLEETPEKRLVSEKTSTSEKVSVPEMTPAPRKSTEREKGGHPLEKAHLREMSHTETLAAPEKASVLAVRSALEQPKVLEKAPAKLASSRKLVSERASIFEKSLVSDKSSAETKRAAVSEQEAPRGSAVTAKDQRGRPSPRENSPSDPPPMASRLPPITLQVKIPSREEEVDASSPSQLTYSSSLKRSSSRTISFRMSPRKENSESPFTRSASVRLPASSARLGEKLERYHTAIQRSESVRSPSSSRAEVFVAPSGVASKRHLFEKELVGQGRAEPVSIRKENLRLSGVVTSKLNLWISRTQESGEQDPQEVRKEATTASKTQRGKKPETSLDVEVNGVWLGGGVPGSGAVGSPAMHPPTCAHGWPAIVALLNAAPSPPAALLLGSWNSVSQHCVTSLALLPSPHAPSSAPPPQSLPSLPPASPTSI